MVFWGPVDLLWVSLFAHDFLTDHDQGTSFFPFRFLKFEALEKSQIPPLAWKNPVVFWGLADLPWVTLFGHIFARNHGEGTSFFLFRFLKFEALEKPQIPPLA